MPRSARNDMMPATVQGPGTFTFWWKAASESSDNELEFRIDGVLKSSISSNQDWQEKSYQITGSGTHTLKWTYSRSDPDNNGEGWVDYCQWTGTLPMATEPDTDDWKVLTYTYDASGRRIAKTYDGDTILKYVYDGDHCIAEYDAFGGLHRKYIYGPCVDEPISMIESAGSYAGTYYYHFDGLGSVVALTNSSGNTVEVYEYSVYGQVGASDTSHPNRFMFTGREFDKETGLYYYRARYYNPQIGRFLQTDPVGYGPGMNLYRYCRNSPVGLSDPSGCDPTDTPPVGGSSCRQEADGCWVWEFTFPLRVIAALPTENNAAIHDQAATYFSQAGFFTAFQSWHLVSARVSGDAPNQNVTVTFRTDPMLLGVAEPCRPKLGVVTIRPTDKEGGHAGDPLSIITVDGVYILNLYTLNQMTAPEFKRIDEMACTLENWYNLLQRWDSEFINIAGPWAFTIGGKQWQGGEINYIAWGHAAAHFHISELGGWLYVAGQKLFKSIRYGEGTWPWSQAIDPYAYWYSVGYNGVLR